MKNILLVAPFVHVASAWRLQLHDSAPHRVPYSVRPVFEWDDPHRIRGLAPEELALVYLVDPSPRHKLILEIYKATGAKVFDPEKLEEIAQWLRA